MIINSNKTSQDQFSLVIFDLDGTLAPMDADTLYPDAAAWFEQNRNHRNPLWMIATNQGGIGLRYWMEHDGFGDPTKYPTLETFEARLEKLFPFIPKGEYKFWILMCTRYQSKTSGKWCPVPEWGKGFAMWREDWRKPAPGMLEHAMQANGFEPEETLMVGDSEEDMQAAVAANCAFMWANDFFGRDKKEQS